MSLLLPVPADQRARRFVQLYLGLVLYGVGTALLVRSELGLDPWDVLHQGTARLTGMTIGISTVAWSALVLLLWIPLRQRPGLGTVSNAILIGLAVDAVLLLIPDLDALVWRSASLAGGVLAIGVATGAYIGAGMGPGPRDGLMTGLAARGHSIRMVRTGLEVAVLAVGWLLGGTVGIGTLIFALSIGPLAHVTIPAFTIGKAEPVLPPEDHPGIL